MKTINPLLHILSAMIMAIFIFLAISSDLIILTDVLSGNWERETIYPDNATKTVTTGYSSDSIQMVQSQTGRFDQTGRLKGPVTTQKITYVVDSARHYISHLTINYRGGFAHGMGILHSKSTPPGIWETDTVCYHYGSKRDCEKFTERRNGMLSAFDILLDRYPLFLENIEALLFEVNTIESYMDTIQSIIASYPFDELEFENYYDDAQDALEDTEFELFINVTNDLFILELLKYMVNGEFRLAVFDRYLSDMTSTYQVLQTWYPNYISNMADLDVTEDDLEHFCHVFDSLMDTYDVLEIDDVQFPDSLDALMIRALNEVDSLDTESLTDSWDKRLQQIMYYIQSGNISSSSQRGVLTDTKNSILLWSLAEFILEADKIRAAQREAYFRNNAVIFLPEVTTAFLENLPNNQVEIEGFVLSDGGSEISQRGIVWARHNNPTIGNDTLNAGSGTGQFSVILSDMQAGENYFARSFAVNEVGLSYGNSVRFVAEEISATSELGDLPVRMNVYPNPAKDMIHIQLPSDLTDFHSLQIFDMTGKLVRNMSNSMTNGGQNNMRLNISDLQVGIYVCKVSFRSGNQLSKKMSITR
jgi:hypothetical protein